MVRSTRYIEYLKDPQLNTTAWAFKRANTQPSRPTGGSYVSPLPSSGGWTRQVPSGEEKLWCVTRVFTSDGLAPQEENWSVPRSMSDTADFDMLFSEAQSPNPPSGHPNTNAQWSDISTDLTTWMAVSRKRNGTWTAWQVFRTRGNDGTSLTPKGSFAYYFATQSEADAAVSGGTWQSGKYALMLRNNAPAVALYNGSTVSYTAAQIGNAYIKEDTGEFYVAEADRWRNVGVVRGPAGSSAYIHIKFATSLTRNSWTGDNGEIPGPYIGIYADNEPADRLNWDLYSWMQWKGADGYGYEYIYKRTSSASAPAVPSTSENTDGYLPSGWSADPVSTTNTYKYCWLAYRRKTDGSWGAWRGSDANTASLWSKYGEKGDKGDNAYMHIKFANSLTTNDWTDNDGDTPGPYIGIYSDNTQSASLVWSKYSWMRWTGQDGYGYEYIYKRTSSASAPSVPSTSENTDGYVPQGWNADPVSTTNTYKYCWLCYRKKTDGVWSAWRGSDANNASLWSKYGEPGQTGPTGPQGPQGPATPVYMLKPNKDSIDFHSNGNGASYAPGLVSLRCGYVKCVGETTTSYDYPSTGVIEGKYYLLFRLIKANGQPEPTFGGNQANGWDWIDNNSSGYKDGDGNLIIPSTTTYSAVEFVLSSAFPSLANDTTDILAKASIPIRKVKDGERGPRPRGPRAWSDCPVGTSFMSGAEGEPSFDVVLYNGHYYDCDKSHTKTADNYPGSAISEQQGYWNLAMEQEFVATKIMLAAYALVKNLGVECIDMRDANDNILFQAKDGNVSCKTGTFEGVRVIDALIKRQRNPFVQIKSSFSAVDDDTIFNSNLAKHLWVTLGWDVKQAGRRIVVVGSANFQPPSNSNQHYYVDGKVVQSFQTSFEMTELIGFGTETQFLGWIVTNRVFFMTNKNMGRKVDTVAYGIVQGTTYGASFVTKKICYRGNGDIYVERADVGIYFLHVPRDWFASADYVHCMVCGRGSAQEQGAQSAVFANVWSVTEETYNAAEYYKIQIFTADDSTRNDGGFYFELKNLAAWDD